MKKIICALLVMSMLLCLAACGGSGDVEPAGNNNAPAVDSSLHFAHKGTKIYMHADAAPILTALGEPKSYTEETSCAFDGLDKTYFYGSFYLQTYPMGDKDYVFSLWIVDDSVTTPEGLYIGATQSEAEAACGADSYNGSNAYVCKKGNATLTVILQDGAVSSIQYDAVVE